jgi:predicted DNA-binding WGR domain protein
MPQPQPDYRVHLVCRTSGPTGGKFWIAEVHGRKAIVRWGPVSKTGQSKEYEFGSQTAATTFVLDKKDEKRGKGYYEVSQQTPTGNSNKAQPAKPKPNPPKPPPAQSINIVSDEALSWDF